MPIFYLIFKPLVGYPEAAKELKFQRVYMKIELHYGDGLVGLDIPEPNIGQVIRPWSGEQETDNSTLLQQAIARAEVADFSGKSLCVLVPDGTRDLPLKDIFAQLFALLKKASLVRFFICTGPHNADTGENRTIAEQIQTEAANAVLVDFEIHIHDCQKDDFINAGKTGRGTDEESH